MAILLVPLPPQQEGPGSIPVNRSCLSVGHCEEAEILCVPYIFFTDSSQIILYNQEESKPIF